MPSAPASRAPRRPPGANHHSSRRSPAPSRPLYSTQEPGNATSNSLKTKCPAHSTRHKIFTPLPPPSRTAPLTNHDSPTCLAVGRRGDRRRTCLAEAGRRRAWPAVARTWRRRAFYSTQGAINTLSNSLKTKLPALFNRDEISAPLPSSSGQPPLIARITNHHSLLTNHHFLLYPMRVPQTSKDVLDRKRQPKRGDSR